MAIPDSKLGAFHEWARLEARAAASPAPLRASMPPWRRAVALVAKVFLLAVLPFFVLVRTSVALYSHQRYPSWVALAAGVGCMLVVVTVYGAWLSLRLTGRARILTVARGVALPLVVAYCGYALLYLSAANAKSERVQAYYTSLHPLLRIALSTWILFDREIVITDVAR